MPTATTRNRRPRRTSARSTDEKKTAAESASSAEASNASKDEAKQQPTTTTQRSTHRGSRSGRGRTRTRPKTEKPEEKPTVTPSATDSEEIPEPKTRPTRRGTRGGRNRSRAGPKSEKLKDKQPATPTARDTKEEAKTRPTRRGGRGGRGRSRSSSTDKAAPELKEPSSAATATAEQTAARKTTARGKSRSITQRTRKQGRETLQVTAPRPKIPITGAPSDEVPEPFAHNAEYEFARILDFYGIDWRYEPRSFPLRYDRGHVTEAFTPDFYLPDLNLYVELTTIKPNLSQEKNRKMRLLKEMYPEINIMLIKKRDYLRLLAKYGYGPLKPNQVPEVDKVLLSATKIQHRIAELGAQISHDYADSSPVLVGVLRGVMCFMADLMRNVSVDSSVDFMAISSYEGNGAAAVRILKDLDENIKGKDVILVEDIVDTGMTLNHLIDYLQTKRPRSIRVCTLLDKRARRLVNVPLEYVGFEIPDNFVVGYGLDFRQRFRNLPFIATLKHELLP